MRTVKRVFDSVVVGGGIGGACLARTLATRGKTVAILERRKVGAGASACAAFLCPTTSAPVPYTSLVQQAFKFSVNEFYPRYFPKHYRKTGVLFKPEALPRMAPEKWGDLFVKRDDGYFCESAGHIEDPVELCENLTQHKNISVFEDFSVKKFESNVTNWKINDEFQAGEVILCTGFDTSLVDNLPYLRQFIKPLFGETVEFSAEIPHNFQDFPNILKLPKITISVRPSQEKLNSRRNFLVVSTHVRPEENSHKKNTKKNVEDDFEINIPRIQELLIDPIMKLFNLKNEKVLLFVLLPPYPSPFFFVKKVYLNHRITTQILKINSGTRGSTSSIFPVVGPLVDPLESFKLFPFLFKTENSIKISSEKLPLLRNFFIFSGFGGKGYSLAPFLAPILADHMESQFKFDSKSNQKFSFLPYIPNSISTLNSISGPQLPAEILPVSLFLYWTKYESARKFVAKLKSEENNDFCYKVTRLDIHGTKYDVKEFLTEKEAEQFCQEMTDRQHHQWYYVEKI